MEWVADFDAIKKLVWELAKNGGPVILGNDSVIGSLQTRFPFLVAEGLKHAVFLCAYYAWHEGYDRGAPRQ